MVLKNAPAKVYICNGLGELGGSNELLIKLNNETEYIIF